MALPASGYFSNTNRTVGEIQQALEDQRNFIAGSTDAEAGANVVRDSGGTFKVGAPTDPAHPVRLSEVAWLGTAVAETKALMSDNSALYPPTDSSLFRYILLSEGMDDAGQYNDGILINETITGSGVERQVTAEINLPESPLHGQAIHLINSERSHLRPSETAGVFEQDQMQRITGNSGTGGFRAAGNVPWGDGAINGNSESNIAYQGGTNGRGRVLEFDSANSSDARTSAATDGETRVKSVSAIYFMRVA